MSQLLTLDQMVNLLRAAGEPTRLRLLALLAEGDLTVSDLIEILGQSQPRISRHLKLLSEAGLLERYQEGAWAFYRLTDQGYGSGFITSLVKQINSDDPQVARDRERLEVVREKRSQRALEYFSQNAAAWNQIRSLHIDEKRVEASMLELVGDAKISVMLDLGTGTGRVLELFSHLFEKGIGLDASRDMLSIARSSLDKANLSRVQTRQGDMYHLPVQPNSIDLITIHQVLHYLDDPAGAIRESAKALSPGGRLLIADFAPHELEFLQVDHAHVRLGFSDQQMREWLEAANLEVVKTAKLEPENNDSEKLTVCLWLAKDKREN